jgi:hypothetical protein
MEPTMGILSKKEERAWEYILRNRTAEAAEIATACEVSLKFAQQCIDRIGTPREVFEAELVQSPLTTGHKDDRGKAPYHLIAPEFLDATAQVLQFGAAKYAERNWEQGMNWSRPFSALMRHMWAWWRGERADPETGMSHLWHAACCIMFLLAYEARAAGNDDRPNT